MKGRRKLLLMAVFCVAVVLAACLVLSGEHEPVYEGHLLSEWLLRENMPHSVPRDWKHTVAWDWERRNEIIWLAGTNTLPWLLKWTSYDCPAWKTQLLARFNKLPKKLRFVFAARLLGERQEQLRGAAGEAFYLLGPDASPAIPALVERLKPTCSTNTQSRAKLCLASIIPTVEALVGRLDSNPHMAEIAARGLGKWGRDKPEYVVPALAGCLEKEKWSGVQFAAAASLGEFGQDARPAAPVLRGKVHSLDPEVRAATIAALQRIAPEVLDEELGPLVLANP